MSGAQRCTARFSSADTNSLEVPADEGVKVRVAALLKKANHAQQQAGKWACMHLQGLSGSDVRAQREADRCHATAAVNPPGVLQCTHFPFLTPCASCGASSIAYIGQYHSVALEDWCMVHVELSLTMRRESTRLLIATALLELQQVC